MESMRKSANNIIPSSSTTLQNPEAVSHLQESIASVLSRWTGLQMAVHNQWGGHDSFEKSRKLAADIFSWLSQSKARLYVEDVENFLHECMLLTFNTDLEDGSIEEVAEELMSIHEEYLQGNQSM
ncbi:uncharacterized protein LOC107423155 [Ziziphus jujuba]|uniref:Uncharacterized protein LOC107423155 n=1 Tax=Ziziphus jujuba TaxID=326968 RepID=A0A6P4A4C9_ZIZJJ|nr:uncharacterized protein LOC107423155 [Ziziphus jujuba]